MTYIWDFERIKYNRVRTKKKPIKAFKGSEVRKFKSISHAMLVLDTSRQKIINAANMNLRINGYELEWD